MGTIAPPPSFQGSNLFEPKKASIRLIATDAITRITVFNTEVTLSVAPIVQLLDLIPLKLVQPLVLNLEVTFPARPSMRASASTLGLNTVGLQLESARRLLVEISHSRSTKECHLICLENGATSHGPCLSCPDGDYEVRICC